MRRCASSTKALGAELITNYLLNHSYAEKLHILASFPLVLKYRIRALVAIAVVCSGIMAQKSGYKPIGILIAVAILLVIVALAILTVVVFNPPPAPTPTATPSAMPKGTPFATSPPISPLEPGYLPYPYPNGNASSVYLLSATYSYGTYPFGGEQTLRNETPVQEGDTCFIINVTLRNDYTLENPPPNQISTNTSTSVDVTLTAHIFNAQGQVNANDVSPDLYYAGGFVGTDAWINSGARNVDNLPCHKQP